MRNAHFYRRNKHLPDGRFYLAVTLTWLFIFLAARVTGLESWVNVSVELPWAFKLRNLVRGPTALNAKLKIFSLDDSTYAWLGKPQLSGDDWAVIFTRLQAAHPAAVVTTHMFGTGEFTGSEKLVTAAKALTANGARLVAAAFAYPNVIAYRSELPLDRPEFQTAPPTLDQSAIANIGWHLYGPDTFSSKFFSAIGHVDYDGRARVTPFVRVGPGRFVPHLGLASLFSIKDINSMPRVPTDAGGRMIVDVMPQQFYAERAKSLRSLLEEDFASHYVSPGDTVLILVDMYTGRASFTETPAGKMPGGYVATAMINSSMTGTWIRSVPSTLSYAAALAAGVLGIISGAALTGWMAVTVWALGSIGVLAFGLLTFAHFGIATPWFGILLTFNAMLVTFASHRLIRAWRNDRETSQRAAREAEKLNAAVRAAQMVAHDIRRPFSMLGSALDMLKRQNNPGAMEQTLRALVPELNRSMAAAENMISDLMAAQGDGALNRTDVQVEDLIADALRAVFMVQQKAEVEVSYKWHHTLPVAVDLAKTRRILGNLIDNAVEAMSGKGKIWVHTRDSIDDGRAFVELCIGNSDSYIAPEDQRRVFDTFYTSGKANGTGLGLAIAHKFTVQHGGRIWCSSLESVGTEFFVTLPVAQATPASTGAYHDLPASSAAFRSMPHTDEAKPLIAVVDDDIFTLDAWQAALTDARVLTFTGPREFWRKMTESPELLKQLACVVTDLYFADGDVDGAAFSEELARQTRAPILLSSSATISQAPNPSVTAAIPKEPVDFAALRRHFRRHG